MKYPLLGFICTIYLLPGRAQYYYKDLIVPRQAAEQLHQYRQHKIKSVRLDSYESDGQPTEKFAGNQQVDQNFTRITTTLQSALSGSSQLTSTFSSAGMLVKTADTTDGSGSTTEYRYNDRGDLAKIINQSVSAGAHLEREEHVWTIQDGKPSQMLRIKDRTDTTIVRFEVDEKGNVAEEKSSRNGKSLPSYYYYYDDSNRLTDIVSYNIKAKRLLPDYVFEYNDQGWVQTMMVVPEGSSDYQKWYYEYNDGLKARETVFNKRKQLLGKVEYRYD